MITIAFISSFWVKNLFAFKAIIFYYIFVDVYYNFNVNLLGLLLCFSAYAVFFISNY